MVAEIVGGRKVSRKEKKDRELLEEVACNWVDWRGRMGLDRDRSNNSR